MKLIQRIISKGSIWESGNAMVEGTVGDHRSWSHWAGPVSALGSGEKTEAHGGETSRASAGRKKNRISITQRGWPSAHCGTKVQIRGVCTCLHSP